VPKPASRSSLLVIGEVQRNVWTRCGLNSPWPSASGEVGKKKFGVPVSEVVPVHLRQTGCSSHEPVTLCRGETCHVMRGV
jgi:hypothetical protein